jgi:hypothetical protein
MEGVDSGDSVKPVAKFHTFWDRMPAELWCVCSGNCIFLLVL